MFRISLGPSSPRRNGAGRTGIIDEDFKPVAFNLSGAVFQDHLG
jgi:hypothetical protein